MKNRLSTLAVMSLLVVACSATPGASSSPQAAASAPGASAPGSASTGANEGTVLIADGGGTYHDSLIKTTYEPCAQQTGIDVQSTQYDYSLGAIQAQVQGAKEWDVVTFGTFANDQTQADLFLPLDYEVINTPGLTEETKHQYILDYVYSPYIVTYRTDQYSTPPTSWADVWDTEKFPGTRNMQNDPPASLVAALLADGVTPDQLHPIDVDRGLKKLDGLLAKSEVNWYVSGQDMVQNFTSGLTPIGTGWLARTLNAQKEGAPLDYSRDEIFLGPTSWAVLKTAPHPKAAMEFIKCAVQAERQAADTVDFLGNVPGNPAALDLLDDATKAVMPNPDSTSYLDPVFWGNNYESILAQWQEWFASK